MNNKALILLAHGSHDPRWRAPFETLLAHVQEGRPNHLIALAYMEMAEPKLEDIVETFYAQGIRQCLILPLFMSSGGHVGNDLPQDAALMEERFAGLSCTLLPAIGEHQAVQAAFAAVIGLLMDEPES